jgi:hypothetical protein
MLAIGKNTRLYLKNNCKRIGSVVPVVELLPSKCKALNSSLSTENKSEERI